MPVYARASGADVDPTSDTVQMAFLTGSGDPVSGDWETASWESDATFNPIRYYARCIVGGTGSGATAELARGTYHVWLKVVETTETIVERVGLLIVE